VSSAYGIAADGLRVIGHDQFASIGLPPKRIRSRPFPCPRASLC